MTPPAKWQMIWRRFVFGKKSDVPVRIPIISKTKQTRQIMYADSN